MVITVVVSLASRFKSPLLAVDSLEHSCDACRIKSRENGVMLHMGGKVVAASVFEMVHMMKQDVYRKVSVEHYICRCTAYIFHLCGIIPGS
jgi:hypothetical protein